MNPKTLSRRQALASLGTVSLGGVLAACGSGDGDAARDRTTAATATHERSSAAEPFDSAASCTIAPEQAEGPYYFDVDSLRTDIREDREGALLRLGIRVRDAAACEPIENAVVDIWHCDAGGAYSGFESADEETFLRGAQATNADGIVEFRTIYPGWYPGRTVHIHAKVHLDRRTVLTTQLYFDEQVSDRVYAKAPYAARGPRDQSNDADGIFDQRLTLTVSEEDGGYRGLITLDIERA